VRARACVGGRAGGMDNGIKGEGGRAGQGPTVCVGGRGLATRMRAAAGHQAACRRRARGDAARQHPQASPAVHLIPTLHLRMYSARAWGVGVGGRWGHGCAQAGRWCCVLRGVPAGPVTGASCRCQPSPSHPALTMLHGAATGCVRRGMWCAASTSPACTASAWARRGRCCAPACTASSSPDCTATLLRPRLRVRASIRACARVRVCVPREDRPMHWRMGPARTARACEMVLVQGVRVWGGCHWGESDLLLL